MDVKDFIPGKWFKLYINENNCNNCLYHIRGIVDDLIICRSWNGKHWCYEFIDILKIEMFIKNHWIQYLEKE